MEELLHHEEYNVLINLLGNKFAVRYVDYEDPSTWTVASELTEDRLKKALSDLSVTFIKVIFPNEAFIIFGL